MFGRMQDHDGSRGTFGRCTACACVQVISARSAAGVSSKMLGMYLIQLIFRLRSTLITGDYLPIDRSNDRLYQAPLDGRS